MSDLKNIKDPLMTLTERKEVLVRLGDHLRGEDEYLRAVMHRAEFNNPWFTRGNQEKAVQAIAEHYLDAGKLDEWLGSYEVPAKTTDPKAVGLVLAGNIPLVGFHDVLSVFVSGHRSVIKLSEKDQYLLPYLLQLLERFDERTTGYFTLSGRLSGFDAVVATGSNNSARYFESYFGKYPHIIRCNRNAVAVLTGQETPEELHALGRDIFSYFGLGCRNVSKVYVPRAYDLMVLLEALHEYRDISRHEKYKHNFDYNYALYVLNKESYLANGCIILTEKKAVQSRIAGLHYEYYDDLRAVESDIALRSEEIQCVVAREGVLPVPTLSFGEAQAPELWDYADGVDTLAFLLDL